MKYEKLPDGSLEVLLKEYDALRSEISDRLKIAFTHVALVGAIVAFAVPASDKIPGWVVPISLGLAVIGVIALAWVALVNICWVLRCGEYLVIVEKRINGHFDAKVLGWHECAKELQEQHWLFVPLKRDGRGNPCASAGNVKTNGKS